GVPVYSWVPRGGVYTSVVHYCCFPGSPCVWLGAEGQCVHLSSSPWLWTGVGDSSVAVWGLSDHGPVTYVALGLLKRSDPPHYWKRYKVKLFYPHPEYQPPSNESDARSAASMPHTQTGVVLKKFTAEECASQYPAHRHLLRGYNHTTQYCPYAIIGVTSSGHACGTPGQAGLYTRVSYYVPWIESLIWPN
ncbi:Hemolymph proteinase 18, partial [Operophtera brumata]